MGEREVGRETEGGWEKERERLGERQREGESEVGREIERGWEEEREVGTERERGLQRDGRRMGEREREVIQQYLLDAVAISFLPFSFVYLLFFLEGLAGIGDVGD